MATLPVSDSWSVNVIDGVLLIVAHLMNIGGTNSQLYLFLYKPVYIYICWTIEVCVCVLMVNTSSFCCRR